MNSEKKTLKIVFWCVSPLIFLGLFRLFWLVFGFIFGGLVYLLLGSQFTHTIGVVSLIISLIFTTLALRWLYMEYKKHFLNKN